MKHAMRFAAAFLTLTAIAHQSAAQNTAELVGSLQERNKAVVRAYLEEISNRGNFSAFDRFFAPDVVFNGSTDVKQQLVRQQALKRAFPDHRLVIEEQIAEGDKVVTRVTFRATHQGEFNGIPATGKAVEYAGTAVDRLVEGRVVQMWHVVNLHSLLQQIATPQPAAVKP